MTTTNRMSDARRAQLEPYLTERAFLLPKELLEVRAELDRARQSEKAQREVIEALADALRGERSISGSGDCGCENEGAYPYVCVTCRGTKALEMLANLNNTK